MIRVHDWRSILRSGVRGSGRNGRKQHARIVSALKAHDPDAAEAAMRDHLREILVSLGPVAERDPDWFEPDDEGRVALTF
ncbi:FCD domain-containing protein [Paraburkholderia sediminicola]|uniref:FCD domain-containing protein n=1 Tax=Paraburkholderia sediminicola TaxID=458836 RepID=UPI0038B97DBF